MELDIYNYLIHIMNFIIKEIMKFLMGLIFDRINIFDRKQLVLQVALIIFDITDVSEGTDVNTTSASKDLSLMVFLKLQF